MDKREYFFKALNAGACKKRAWVNSVFAVVSEDLKTVKKDQFPYRIVHLEDERELYFIDPERDNQLTPIEGSDRRRALYAFREGVQLHPGEFINYTGKAPLETTYGNLLVNYFLLVIPFGNEIPYQTGYVSISSIESMILTRLVDDPQPDTDQSSPPGKIYVREYLVFCDHALSLVGYNSIAVTSTSPKAMLSHPDARKRRNELVAQYKGQLTDPAIVAKIGNELEALDREWLAGDPTMDYYRAKEKKLIGAVRKKMFYMFGGESAFQDGTTVEFIQKSLEEGIDITQLPALFNSLRYGSYNRGAQTQLGGESTKTIYRMLGTIRIAEDDCNGKIGIPMAITPKNSKRFVGFHVLDKGKTVLLTDENVGQYVGTSPQVRGPLTCKTEGRNVCSKCAGTDLSEQPEGLAAAAAGLGGTFLSLFLAMMHAKALTTAKWDLSKRLS